MRIDAPCGARASSSRSRTSRALCDAGKSFADSDFFDERNAGVALEEGDLLAERPRADDLAERCGGESVTKRDSSSRAGRMLQRPPPLIRILRPPSAVRSRSSRLGAGRGGKDRRHRPGRAGADDGDPVCARSNGASLIAPLRPGSLASFVGFALLRGCAEGTVISERRSASGCPTPPRAVHRRAGDSAAGSRARSRRPRRRAASPGG